MKSNPHARAAYQNVYSIDGSLRRVFLSYTGVWGADPKLWNGRLVSTGTHVTFFTLPGVFLFKSCRHLQANTCYWWFQIYISLNTFLMHSMIELKVWTVKKKSEDLNCTKQCINLHPERGYTPLKWHLRWPYIWWSTWSINSLWPYFVGDFALPTRHVKYAYHYVDGVYCHHLSWSFFYVYALVILLTALLSPFNLSPKLVLSANVPPWMASLLCWDVFHFGYVTSHGPMYEHEWAFLPPFSLVMSWSGSVLASLDFSQPGWPALLCEGALVMMLSTWPRFSISCHCSTQVTQQKNNIGSYKGM